MPCVDMRKKMQNEKQETENKSRTSSESNMSWTNERQQLLDRNQSLQKKLYFSERDSKRFKSNLQRGQEEIDFLRHKVSVLEKTSDEERIASRTEFNKEHEKAEEEMKKTDERINALHQSLLAQKKENERMRASIDDLEVFSGRKATEEWQKKISHFEKLVTEKDTEITRITEKRQARTMSYFRILMELTETQLALKQSEMTCQAIEEKFKKQMAASEERFRKESLKSEKNFRKELSETQMEDRKEMFHLNDTHQWKAQQWEREKEKMERTLLEENRTWTQKEALMIEEIRRLTEENIKLQDYAIEVTPKSGLLELILEPDDVL